MTFEGVNVLITDLATNTILCVLRPKNDPVFPDMWALPGGSIESGETHHQTAIREAKEESNANITEISAAPVLTGTLPYHEHTLVINIYAASISNKDEVSVNTSDIADVKWITPRALLDSIKKSNYPSVEVEKLTNYLQKLTMNTTK
jgi:8-oxo-dGTP pyrophosphatase MutT (NUDIX family)